MILSIIDLVTSSVSIVAIFLANLILRPCDQYPSEPGVLKSRPLSSLSAHSSHGVGSIPQSYGSSAIHGTINSHDEEGYDSENGVFIKPSKTAPRSKQHQHLSNTGGTSVKNKVR